jgi:hypothetical protein
MSFEIDTGQFAPPAQQTAKDFIPDWARDQCPAEYEDWQVVQSYAHHIIGDMHRPAKLETVIKHMLMNWRFLGALGHENPGLFQEIWTAFAERVDGQ